MRVATLGIYNFDDWQKKIIIKSFNLTDCLVNYIWSLKWVDIGRLLLTVQSM